MTMTMLTYLQREQCQPGPRLIYQCTAAPVHRGALRIDVAVSDRGGIIRRRYITATPGRRAFRGAKYHSPTTICRPLWQYEQAGCLRRPERGTLWFVNGAVAAPAGRGSVWGRVRGSYTEPDAATAFPIGRTIRWSWLANAGTEARVVVSKGGRFCCTKANCMLVDRQRHSNQPLLCLEIRRPSRTRLHPSSARHKSRSNSSSSSSSNHSKAAAAYSAACNPACLLGWATQRPT